MTVDRNYSEYVEIIEGRQSTLEKYEAPKEPDFDGCPECKVVYSLFFKKQFHKEGCSQRSEEKLVEVEQ